MKKGLLWVCIIIGGIALLCLLFNLFVTIISISLWLIRAAAIVLLICLIVIGISTVKGRMSR